METLRMVTKTIMGTFLGNPHFGQPYAKNLNQAYEEMQELVERINVELSFIEVMDQLDAGSNHRNALPATPNLGA
jgi:hypothetical protein